MRHHGLILRIGSGCPFQILLQGDVIVELVRAGRLHSRDPLRRASDHEKDRHVKEGLGHHGEEVEDARLPQDPHLVRVVDAILGKLVEQHAVQEDAAEGDDSNGLEYAVDQEGPAVHGERRRQLVVGKVCDQNAVQRGDHEEDRHEHMDHQQLDPKEDKAPDEHSALSGVTYGREDPRKVVGDVHQLAETQGVPLGLHPSGDEGLENGVTLGRVVQYGQEDRRYPQAPSSGEEALQGHVPILRDEVRVPSVHPHHQLCGDGVRRVRNAGGVRVGQVGQLVLASDEGRQPHHGGLRDVVLEVQDRRLPDRQVPVRRLALRAAGVEEVVGEAREVLRVELAVRVADREDAMLPLYAHLRDELTDDLFRGPLRVGRLARDLPGQPWRVVGREDGPELILELSCKLVRLRLGSNLPRFHRQHEADVLLRDARFRDALDG
mmetsp:Transcript_33105/g.87540  ORF Transcript_33105/g.87540 Transcript_33105/m.87540 type:complete len:435 (+) Transcript_33105:138-1442(+)